MVQGPFEQLPRARPCSFQRACAARPSPRASHTQTLFDASTAPFFAGLSLGLKNAKAEKERAAARLAEREALVALLVAELVRNRVPPCGSGLHADVGKLREQIAEGKSAAATSGTTWQ